MFGKFAHFFIKNGKLTFILVLIILFSGIGSYQIISKQYNPTIIAPAFQILVNTPGMTADENKRFILNELENKVMEIPGIDKIYGISNDHFVGMMVQFLVGENPENAKIQLTQKITQNLDLKPIGVDTPIIKAITPDELPQITYAIHYIGSGTTEISLSETQQQIYLRQITQNIKNTLKTIANVTTLDIVGGMKKNIVISLDLQKLDAYNIDILQVYQILKENDTSFPNGNFHTDNSERIFLETSGKINTISEVENILIMHQSGKSIYLKDIASFAFGEKRITSYSFYSDSENQGNQSVLLGIGKQVGSNSVVVTDAIKNTMQSLLPTLPKDIGIEIIQDEGHEAQLATHHLITDLIQSIIIVVVILILFLGWKNALNTATSIPLILGLVFLYSLIVGYDINRISLFALILVIGMLVDDSIVVVENIHRHLEERFDQQKTKLQAILDAVEEVGPGVILSTITKVLSFVGMFAVTGMMGEYMGPIPKFAIVALLFSIIIAFSINPWVSFMTTKDTPPTGHKVQEPSKYDIRKYYLKFMNIFLQDNKKSQRKRKIFKATFWISLLLVFTLPVYFGIFKARMLPKSNKDQIYLWIDAPRGWSIEKMLEIEEDIENFFLKNTNIPEKLNITQSVTSTLGTPFMGDFANLFRGGMNRTQEYQLSSRINLIPQEENEQRIRSENYTFLIRPYLEKFLLEKYPDITMRLLEDPPGPPVRATFMIKISGNGETEEMIDFTTKVYQEVNKIKNEEKLVDLGVSLPTTYRKIQIKLDHDAISRAGLSVQQVTNTLNLVKNATILNIIKDSQSFEAPNIILSVQNNQSENLDLLNNIFFTSSTGKKIPLSSIANITYDFVGGEIQTDERETSHFIYAEMGDNSVVYPIIKLMKILKSSYFLGEQYSVIKKSLYEIQYQNNKNGNIYTLKWDGEWKLTLDTFRDLGTAMIIAIAAIYFLIVGQFKSFGIAGIIMLPFLLGFFGIMPGFSFLYLFKNEYFNATGMIGVISLAGIVVGNAILLIDYIHILKERGWTIEKAILNAGYIRFMPIMLTSISAIFGAIKITADPVWSGLARSIVWGLSASAILTLIVIPIFYYESQKHIWDKK